MSNRKPNRVLILYANEFGMFTDMHTGKPIVSPETANALVDSYAPWAQCYQLVRGGIKCMEQFPTDSADENHVAAGLHALTSGDTLSNT